jgi:hypothetical protein
MGSLSGMVETVDDLEYVGRCKWRFMEIVEFERSKRWERQQLGKHFISRTRERFIFFIPAKPNHEPKILSRSIHK